MARWTWLLALCSLMALLAVPLGVARAVSAPGQGAAHVLFIGNSYTRSNNLPSMVKRLADRMPGGRPFRVTAVANPGWDLQHHWAIPGTRRLVATGQFTHVVLQGHSMTTFSHREDFEGAVRRFDQVIDGIGARTVLYETWARHPRSGAYRRSPVAESPTEMQARVTDCYAELARSVDADLAPVGRAFLLAQHRLPQAALFRSDGAHPRQDGTYLAAAVLYATITRQDPRRSAWVPYRTDRYIADELRDVAYRTVFAR